MTDAMTDCLVVGAGALATSLYDRWKPRSMAGISRRDKELPFPLFTGDTTTEEFWRRSDLPQKVAQILITATPGLRKGGAGNGLLAMCHGMYQRYPQARVVYTGSTAVYGDGAVCDEHAPLLQTGRSPALQAIEQAVLHWENALVLRVGAIVGPSRPPKRLQQIVDGNKLSIAGDPQRPFPFIHEHDVLQVLQRGLMDHSLQGVLNCVAPYQLSYADYYQGYMPTHKLSVLGDDTSLPSRRILARPLWDLFATHTWLLPWQDA